MVEKEIDILSRLLTGKDVKTTRLNRQSYLWQKRLMQKDVADLLEIYDEIGKQIRSRNAFPEVSEVFWKRLKAVLQSEYDTTGKNGCLSANETDQEYISKDKMDPFLPTKGGWQL